MALTVGSAKPTNTVSVGRAEPSSGLANQWVVAIELSEVAVENLNLNNNFGW